MIGDPNIGVFLGGCRRPEVHVPGELAIAEPLVEADQMCFAVQPSQSGLAHRLGGGGCGDDGPEALAPRVRAHDNARKDTHNPPPHSAGHRPRPDRRPAKPGTLGRVGRTVR